MHALHHDTGEKSYINYSTVGGSEPVLYASQYSYYFTEVTIVTVSLQLQ